MATATATVLGGITLTGSTPAPDSAPIIYMLKYPTGRADGPLSSLVVARTVDLDADRIRVIFSQGYEAILPKNQYASFLAGLSSAKNEVDSQLRASVKVAAPAPAPSPAKVTSTSTTTQVTSTSNSTATTKTTVTKVSSPPATTDPSKPAQATVLTKADLVKPPVITGLKPTALPKIDQPVNAPAASGAAKGLTNAKQSTIIAATNQDQANFQAAPDWRVRLVLAPESNYFYNASGDTILAPLAKSRGVIFPYMPSITVNYAANYEPASLVHTNYKIYQYQNSSVDSVSLSCEFTAQDTFEANYLLAVIHFFRSMTKMFYGQDNDPKNGTPPPLCYIQGLGGYQFDNLPLAIATFNYALPNDVDYIPTTATTVAGTTQPTRPNPSTSTAKTNILARLGGKVKPGGVAADPSFGSNTVADQDATWVPTKISLSITAYPMLSRNQVSNKFSLEKYASGALLRGSKNPGGGFW